MEEGIYVILAIGFMIFKIWTSIKGNKTENTPSPVESTIWEGEEPYMEEEVSFIEKENCTKVPETKNRIEHMLAMLGKPRVPQQKPTAKPMANQSMNTKVVESPQTIPLPKFSINRELRSAQGARKAFIYSEIFKRKY